MKRKKRKRRVRRIILEEKGRESSQAPASPEKLEDDVLSTSRLPREQEKVRALQQVAGNQAVHRLLQGKRILGKGAGSAAFDVLRQAEEEQPSPAAAEERQAAQIDASQLGLQEELPGHGDHDASVAGDGPSATATGDETPSGGVAVTVGMTANAPTEERKPAADIAADHNQPDVAGWTTPAYEVEVPHVDEDSIDVDVTLDFNIELAEEYSGETLNVLRDHEYGHVEIGKDVGAEHLVDGLHDDLSSLPDFSSAPPIQKAIVNAAQQFNAAEGNASQAYDRMDYPRMKQAYLGAQTPLSDLAADSTPINAMVDALETFNETLTQADEDSVVGLAQTVIDGHDALEENDLARLQYNPQFKELVEACVIKIEEFIDDYHWDLWIIEFSTLGEIARIKFDELRLVLADFKWQPPV